MIRTRWILAVALMVVVGVVAPAQRAFAADQINGSGSTWSFIAVDEWRKDVAKIGLPVNFQANGSSAGRQFYIQGQSDFAVSEIPFQPASYDRDGNTLYDEIPSASRRPYAYLPIVAGGTSFIYHLDVAGKRVDDLHLSGPTIAKIFTGKITNWNDPAITADDGRQFPDLPITPVLRSDGSGTSAQFTAYMANMFPDIWNPFCSQALNLPTPCPPTSLYPYFGNSKAQAGSDGVANFVVAPYNNGSITYAEYAYAIQRGRWPVVRVLNQAGYYTLPEAKNVAIALTKAKINPDRTQVLNDVYRNPDPRAYPVSSYSYMIVPTTTASPFSEGKGNTLGQFINYFLCTGQRKADQLGYSPLPQNLVEFGFDAVKQIPGAPPPPGIKDCSNPTITGEFNLNDAPPPKPEDKKGAPRPAAGAAAATGRTSGGSGAVTQSDLAAGATTDTTVAGNVTVEDATGVDGVTVSAVRDVPISVSKQQDDVPVGVYITIVVLVLLIAFAPPALALALRKRR